MTSTVSFFVADFAEGPANSTPPVLDPDSGDAVTITVAKPSALGLWLPLDPRDQKQTGLPPPDDVQPVAITANGSDATFIARSLALRKTAAIAVNQGSAGLSPGDELQYTLELSISDYFAYGQGLLGGGNLTDRQRRRRRPDPGRRFASDDGLSTAGRRSSSHWW